MGKKKKDVKPESSPDTDVKPDPSPGDVSEDSSPADTSGVPSPEGDLGVSPEGGQEDSEGVRNLRARLEELAEEKKNLSTQNQQLLDSVFDMQERQKQAQPQEVQVPAEVQAIREKADKLGVGSDFVDDILKVAGGMTQAQVDQRVKENLPSIQSNLDMAQEARVDQMAAKNPKITPYTGEVMDMLKQTPAQTRLQEGIVEQAVALVLYRHDDEIEKRSRAVIRKEVEKRRKVDGESELSGTSVTVDGKDVSLSPEVRELGLKMGKSDEWMAEAMAAHEEKKAARKR